MLFTSVIPTILLAASLVSAGHYQAPKNEVPADWLGPAKIIKNNPKVTYQASFDGTIKGSVVFTRGRAGGRRGTGVKVTVDLSGVPGTGHPGPYGYHIHDQPVPADGNCTLTKAHLDPYKRGQNTTCVATEPSGCEVGDLAGKHGKISADVDNFWQRYTELYASTREGIGAFLGNRSIVIHAADEKKTRIACANIVLVKPEDCDYEGTPLKDTSGDAVQ